MDRGTIGKTPPPPTLLIGNNFLQSMTEFASTIILEAYQRRRGIRVVASVNVAPPNMDVKGGRRMDQAVVAYSDAAAMSTRNPISTNIVAYA